MSRPRGSGSVFRPKYKDRKTGELRQSPFWSIRYFVRGKLKQESTGKSKRSIAEAILRARLRALEEGNPDPTRASKTTFAELIELVIADYVNNDRKSLARQKRSLRHLERFFDNVAVQHVTADQVELYKAHRKQQGAANATINRELAALKKAFRLGEKLGRVLRVPAITLLEERNRRTGFFELEEYQAVLEHLVVDVRPIVVMLYVTGWRVDSEVLTREWRHVDFRARTLRLESHETKNSEPRVFPFTPELEEMLMRQRARTEALERALQMRIPWVFHRGGKPIKDFRRAWQLACEKAGIPGRLLHDFRRTAVRNLERAGVPRVTAKALVGHETDSIYERYGIVDERMLREGIAKLSEHHKAEKRPGKVVPYKKRTSRGRS